MRASLLSMNIIPGLAQSIHHLESKDIEHIIKLAIIKSKGIERSTYKALVAKGLASLGLEEFDEKTCTKEVLEVLDMEL